MPSQDTEAPLAAYRERLPQVGRTLELYTDRIVVRAKWLFGGRYTQTIQLEGLEPRPLEIWVRQRLFKRALALSLLSAAAAVVLTQNGGGGRFNPWLVNGFYIIAMLIGAVAVLSYAKVRFARFPTREGKAGLDIARAGPDAATFDDFVDRVKARIRKSR